MICVAALALAAQKDPGFIATMDQIQHAIQFGPSADTDKLVDKIKSWFGAEIVNGGYPKIDQTNVIWAMEAKAIPTVVSEDGTFTLPLTKLGNSDIYVGSSKFRNGRGFHFRYQLGQERHSSGFIEVYDDDPDMLPQPNIPKGKVDKQPTLTSQIFPHTTRDWWIYTPPGAAPPEGYPVMFFQDGESMKNYVPDCLDNLIAKHKIPPMVAVFINPGLSSDGKSDRSFEYDTLSDTYAKFLLTEIMPAVDRIDPLSKSPEKRGLAGGSSGGICAFTAAWEMPNQFRKVLSFVGSFTDIAHGDDLKQGGHNYPFLIRLSPKKPIRVYLQDGINDLDNQFGNWPLANQSMARALAFKEYDYTFTLGEGAHSDKHFRAILPSMMEWLWR